MRLRTHYEQITSMVDRDRMNFDDLYMCDLIKRRCSIFSLSNFPQNSDYVYFTRHKENEHFQVYFMK